MGTIRSLVRKLLGLSLLAGIASAVAALIARDRLVSSGGEMDDEVDLVTIYDGLQFHSEAPALRRASVLTWYGGTSLDLRDATLDPDGATLIVRTIFGGLEVVVPAAWPVELNVTSLFAGADDSHDPDRSGSDGPVLRVSGWNAFGGLSITSQPHYQESRDGEPGVGEPS
jgi:hypothetical protein